MWIEEWQGEVNYIVESCEDVRGWEILTIEPWKPGVVRLHLRRAMEFCLAYCPVAFLSAIQDAVPHYGD